MRPPVLRLAFAGGPLLLREWPMVLALAAMFMVANGLAAVLGAGEASPGATLTAQILVPIAFNAVASAAVMRAMLRPQQAGLFRLGAGPEEGRLLVFYLLALVVTVVVVVLLAVVFNALAGNDEAGVVRTLTSLLAVVLTCALLIRLSLVGPASFAEQRWRLRTGWRLGGKVYWRLVGAFVIVAMVAAVIYSVLMMGFYAIYQAANLPYPVGLFGPAKSHETVFTTARIVVWTVAGSLQALFAVLCNAVGAEAYLRLNAGSPDQTADVFA